MRSYFEKKRQQGFPGEVGNAYVLESRSKHDYSGLILHREQDAELILAVSEAGCCKEHVS